jgi:site-specific DNA recombinase
MTKSTKRTPSRTESPPRERPDAVALYVRVSTDEQADRETIKLQLDFLRRLAELHNVAVADDYVDDGVSGTIPLGERPEGRRLLDDAEAGRFGSVWFYKVSRLGRKLGVLLDAHAALERLGVSVRSGTEPLDTGTPIGVFVFQLLGSMAELDRETIKENTSRGRDRVAKEGRHTGGPIPVGLDVDEHNRYHPSIRRVEELGCDEADMMREVFRRIANREATAVAEVARLHARGVPRVKRYGGKKARAIVNPEGWTYSSLRQAITNPIYKGEAVLRSRYGTVVRPVPALVDTDTWQRAQDALKLNRSMGPAGRTRPYHLTGLIRCANCGRSYTGSPTDGVRRYRCSTNGGAARGRPCGRCRSKSLPADWLEEQVWDHVREFILDPGAALDEYRARLRERMAAVSGADEQRRLILARLAETDAEEERVVFLFRKGGISDVVLERQLNDIAADRGRLRAELESLRMAVALVEAQEADLTTSARALAKMREELAAIEAADDWGRKREAIKEYVREVVVESKGAGRTMTAVVKVALRLRPGADAEQTITNATTATRGRRTLTTV